MERSDELGPKRRRTRGFVACDACQRRKSRCELVTSRGCHRCQTLQTACSLANVDPLSINAFNPNTTIRHEGLGIDGVKHRLSACAPIQGDGSDPKPIYQIPEEWMQRMETMLKTALSNDRFNSGSPSSSAIHSISQPPSLSDSRPDGVGDGDDIEEPIKRLLQRSLGTSLLMVTGLNLHDRSNFLCPVEQGIVSEADFITMSTTFSARISRILPLELILPEPDNRTDPFLRSCIVDYVLTGNHYGRGDFHYQTPSSRSLLQHNLSLLPSANPTMSLIQGLLILALRPLGQQEQRCSRKMDEEEFCSRALSMAVAYGLDDTSRRALRATTTDLRSDYCRGILTGTLLWYTIIHRCIWNDIFSTPSFTYRPHSTPPVSEVFPPSLWKGHPLISHLVKESQLFDILARLSKEFQRMRNEAFEPTRVSLIEYAWQDFQKEVEGWRTDLGRDCDDLSSEPWLRSLTIHLEILIPFKITTDMRICIASPVNHEEIFGAFGRLVPDIFRFSLAFIAQVTSSGLELRLLPKFFLTMCLMPYTTVVEVAKMQNSALETVAPDIARYKEMIQSAHPLMATMIRNIDSREPSRAWTASDWTGEVTWEPSTDVVPGFMVDDFLRWIEVNTKAFSD